MKTSTYTPRRRTSSLLRLSASVAPLLAALLSPAQPAAAGPLKERAMVAPEPANPRAMIVNERWIQLYLPEKAYDNAAVTTAANYTITSADDPNFGGAGLKAELVQHRHFPETAPYADDQAWGDSMKINVIYRVYVRTPKAMKEGKTYKITPTAAVKVGGPYSVTWSASTPNEAIHVNQVAYLDNGPKIAYLSAWTGQGTIDFGSSGTFQIINEATNTSVFSGNVHLDVAAANEPWSKSNVYSMDFSAFSASGKYHIHVPGVGSSFSFQISPSAFNDIGYTLIRGMTMQRDGNHGLNNAAITHWSRPPAHLDDAVVESNGLTVNLVGGHMDAGDRGKYPHNMADVSGSMLSTIALFPNEVIALGESLQIPESSNGIPDVIDEALYELDFLYKAVMNTPKDGTLPFYLRPQNANGAGGYEQNAPLEGKPKRKLYDETMGPNRAETLYAAGVLAMASNTPLVKQFAPQKCNDYLKAAKRAFQGFKSHTAAASYFKEQGWYDPWKEGPTAWADEMLVAATNLLEATGDAAYLTDLKAALPANLTTVKHWSWQLTGPWLTAFVSLYRASSPILTQGIPGIKNTAKNAIINWGNSAMGNGNTLYAAPFGMPYPGAVMNSVGWYYSGDQTAFPAMIAYGVTGDAKYRDLIVKTWNYLLGGNPLSRTFISGLGDPQHSPRWQVHEISALQWQKYKAGQGGWSEMAPGIPSADLQNGDYDSFADNAWNMARKNNKFPAQASYAPLYRYHDSWTTYNEFTIDRLTRGAMSVIALVDSGPPLSPPPQNEGMGDPDSADGAGPDNGPSDVPGSMDGAKGGDSPGDGVETASENGDSSEDIDALKQNIDSMNAGVDGSCTLSAGSRMGGGQAPGLGLLAAASLLMLARRRSRRDERAD